MRQGDWSASRIDENFKSSSDMRYTFHHAKICIKSVETIQSVSASELIKNHVTLHRVYELAIKLVSFHLGNLRDNRRQSNPVWKLIGTWGVTKRHSDWNSRNFVSQLRQLGTLGTFWYSINRHKIPVTSKAIRQTISSPKALFCASRSDLKDMHSFNGSKILANQIDDYLMDSFRLYTASCPLMDLAPTKR